MTSDRHEPPTTTTVPQEILLGQLRFYRATLLAKLDGLTDQQLRSSVLPSGWSPLKLLNHLIHVERRWMQWGFAGLSVPDPWGDHDPSTDRWTLDPQVSLPGLAVRLDEVADRTQDLAASATLTDLSRTTGRFDPGQARGGEPPPTLGWILIHLLQEYARHVGHLDVVSELMTGRTGE